MNMEMSVDGPWAQPDACWQKASQIVAECGYATARRDGALIQRVVRCVRLLERARTNRGVRRAAMEYPGVYWALRLQQEDSSRVLELKARVLAGQSDQMIARLLGLPTRTVTMFVAMFFDVRPRLKAGTWVRRVAIGLPLNQGPSVESLLLLHAWRHGSAVIGTWFDYIEHQGQRHDLNTEVGLQRAWIEHLIRVQQLPFEPQSLRTLWKLSPFILGKTSEVIKSTTVRTTVLQNRARILAGITWNEPVGEEFLDSNIPNANVKALDNRQKRRLAQAG